MKMKKWMLLNLLWVLDLVCLVLVLEWLVLLDLVWVLVLQDLLLKM